jgi:hypothetical protein
MRVLLEAHHKRATLVFSDWLRFFSYLDSSWRARRATQIIKRHWPRTILAGQLGRPGVIGRQAASAFARIAKVRITDFVKTKHSSVR